MSKKVHESILTGQIRDLLKRMFMRSPLKDSILDKAIYFYQTQMSAREIQDEFARRQVETEAKISHSGAKSGTKEHLNLESLELEKNEFDTQLESERIERLAHFFKICDEILELTEGENFDETNRKSSQVLGTIQLLSHTEGSNVAPTNEQHKALYKSILTLRLFDQLLMDNTIEDAYIAGFIGDYTPEQYKDLREIDPPLFKEFKIDVKRAVLTASLLQDIGNYHPEAQQILVGSDGSLDPYRTLDIEDRKKLLQINFRETLKYLVDGLGMAKYIGNSKQDRDKFNRIEQAKLVFMKSLLKKAIAPKEGIGNLLKIPQIYTSIVLSTKSSYAYKLIPKVYQALNQNAERGHCSQRVVDTFYTITGMFPQGFGVTYIPLDAHGNSLERYEYAIVTHLYPEDPEEPICRIATRQLTFICYGSDLVVKKTENLYFKESAERLAKISKERLLEILEKLFSNYKERAELDLIPRCWDARNFFSIKKNQKLWNKAQPLPHNDDVDFDA